MNNLAGIFTHRLVTYTRDYADHSPYLQKYRKKLEVILPPVELPEIPAENIKDFRRVSESSETTVNQFDERPFALVGHLRGI